MRKFLFAAVAAAAIATPAMARDGTGYVGVEGGLLLPRDSDPASDVDRRGAVTGGVWSDFFDIDHSMGFDVDLIAGYDFGMFRLEGELAYKRAKHKDYQIDANAGGLLPLGVVRGASYDGDGRTSVTSGMINALIDLGSDEGLSFYAGGGLGLARVSQTIETLGTNTNYHLKDHDKLAWQIIAGARMPISDNMDVGLKYRYFAAGTLKNDVMGNPFDYRSSFQSHSLLASLIFNFGAAAPPPPPPPPPATQTCPDGSVILATDACPVPPPPPPPPPPEPERG